MAKARKLPSGHWRCLVYDYKDASGKRHYKSFTASTKKEAELKAAQFAICKNDGETHGENGQTVQQCVQKYIEQKKNVLSPTTYKNYLSSLNTLLVEISEEKVLALNSGKIQAWVGSISIGRKPKTVKNAYGLLIAAIGLYYPDLHFKVKLPQSEKPNLYVPTDKDIKILMSYFQEKDIDMFIACSLAAFGTLRRSEVCALTADDVHGNVIRINKAMVLDTENQWIIKTTKNTSSTRDVELPKFVVDIFPKEGNIVPLTPSQVTNRFINALTRMDIPKFRFHDLRHYSASIMHAIGVPDVYIMQRGGWSSDSTLKNIYRGSMDDFQRKFTDITNNHFEKIQHDLQHKK